MNGIRGRNIFAAVAVLCALGTLSGGAAEVHSNGAGGGAWSEAATWRNNAVPGADDTVTISADDVVVFDRDDGGKATCKDLYVDPKGALKFKPGGKRVMTLAGPIESYGLLRLDASGGADDYFEVVLTGTVEQRAIKLLKGAALQALGRADLEEGKRNVVIRSKPPATTQPAVATMEIVMRAIAGTSLDLRHAHLDCVAVRATKIDNTGAKPGERLNISNCLFTGGGTLGVDACDTPSIVKNTFLYTRDAEIGSAITVTASPLAEVRGNAVTGRYVIGLHGDGQTDSVVSENVVANCGTGIRWGGNNDMFKGNSISKCPIGMVSLVADGVLEDVTFDACPVSLSVAGLSLQATNVRFTNVPKDGVRLQYSKGLVTLVNCDVTAEQVQITKAALPTPTPHVQAMQYCVVAVKGPLPAGAAIGVTTANPPKPLAKGAQDPNVRNVPAEIVGGLTPLPRSQKAIMVGTWVIDGGGKIMPAPKYELSVIAKAEKPEGDGARVKTITVAPDATWYRASPDELRPTVEVSLP